MSLLFENTEDMFSHVEAHMEVSEGPDKPNFYSVKLKLSSYPSI